MRLLIVPIIAVLSAIIAAVPAMDVLAAPKPAHPRVKITFTDGVLPDGAIARIQSDGTGAYVDGSNVVAYIDATTGELNFSTGSSAQRTIHFSFGACIDPCLAEEGTYQMPVDAPYPEGYAPASFLAGVRAADPDNGTRLPRALLGMPIGVAMRSGIKLNIPLDAAPDYWTGCFTPDEGVNGFCGLSNGATPVHIIRHASGQWEMWATDNEVTQLINEVSSRGKVRTIQYLGTYHMPFRLVIDCIANCPS